MRTKHIILVILLAIAMAGCRIIFPIPSSPTATPTIVPKQPEPGRPLVEGEISGVLDNTLVTIHVRTPEGWESLWGTRQGNGLWEAVVTDASGLDYEITAEAEGFVSNQSSYTIHLEGMAAYVVEDGQITSKEAVHLDFHFEPVATVTPAK
jgi:hypothetical protein